MNQAPEREATEELRSHTKIQTTLDIHSTGALQVETLTLGDSLFLHLSSTHNFLAQSSPVSSNWGLPGMHGGERSWGVWHWCSLVKNLKGAFDQIRYGTTQRERERDSVQVNNTARVTLHISYTCLGFGTLDDKFCSPAWRVGFPKACLYREWNPSIY